MRFCWRTKDQRGCSGEVRGVEAGDGQESRCGVVSSALETMLQ